MRCIWSTRAISLQQRVPRHEGCFRAIRENRATHCSRSHVLTVASKRSHFLRGSWSTVPRGPRGVAHASTKVLQAKTRSLVPPGKSTFLSVAQISSAAAKAVRMSMRAGEIADAYYIVNSLQASTQSHNLKPIGKLPILRNLPYRPFIPLEFENSTSPRLSAHALLHGLIRVGLTKKAYFLAKDLMDTGIKLRPKSMEVLTQALLAQGIQMPSAMEACAAARITKHAMANQSVLNLHPRLAGDPTTRWAICLILRARQNRQRCTAEAYYSIIRYCMTRGEILVASLLIYTVFIDWQAKQTIAARLRSQIQSKEEEGPEFISEKAHLKSHLKNVIWERGMLEKKAYMALIASIEKSLANNPQNETEIVSFSISWQALANIAMLLDERRLPFPEIASLIRALYSCPRSDRKVWIIREGRPVRVKAHAYFHEILINLINNLPSKKPYKWAAPLDGKAIDMLPPLDIYSYNALLHYALRHRLDPTLGKSILHHMQNLKEPLKPDVTTYNILTRSGTLLGVDDVSECALTALRRRDENSTHAIMVNSNSQKGSKATQKPLSNKPLSEDNLVDKSDLLKADLYTLSSYIMHLSSTGRPQIVARVLFHVLPALAFVDHPSWGSLNIEKAQELRRQKELSRREHIRRAALLGPAFFVAVLNALSKAGKTGLTERVWLLAIQAERMSWIEDDIASWYLPVHAYTIMMQCYTAEARRGLAMRKFNPWMFDGEDPNWKPLSKMHVRGWARFIISQSEIKGRNKHDIGGHHISTLRHVNARKMGMGIHTLMVREAKTVFKMLTDREQSNISANAAPRPDARFFNACLDLFAPISSYQKLISVYNTNKDSAAMHRIRLKSRLALYARRGLVSNKWNTNIQMIASGMVNYGFNVPLALKPSFVGRWPGNELNAGRVKEEDRRPYGFPRKRDGASAHRLHASRTRSSKAVRTKVGRKLEYAHKSQTDC